MDVKQLYKDAVGSVVVVETEDGSGTGFVVRGDGLVLTNHHVVTPYATVAVRYSDGTGCQGMVVASDRGADLACVSPLAPWARERSPLLFGEEADTEVGDWVMAIGHPGDAAEFSMTHGHVSAVNTKGCSIDGLLQLNMSANWGMSGGPVLCERGRVVGVTTRIVFTRGNTVRVEGLCGAVPLNMVLPFVGTIPALTEDVLAQRQYCAVCGFLAHLGKYCERCGAAFRKASAAATPPPIGSHTCAICGISFEESGEKYCRNCGTKR